MSSDKTMLDAAGQAVPVGYVKPYDKLRDKVARRILVQWLRVEALIQALHKQMRNEVGLVEQAAASGRKGTVALGKKGNFQFQSFDGLIAVSRSARYELRFDERLRVAQSIIEEIIREKTETVDADIIELLRGVFRPTSDGLLSQARVMGLFRLKISHHRWKEAMDLIRESIEARRGKTLYSVRIKKTRESDWQSIELDISSCEDGGAET
jgi:hypothetical protein